ncbi:MAG: class I SAM-dependent methyltransferase [Limnochordales bacterium]|nr:class I SAM-dependent methyltransferase [Limnochordales bacterium]
MSQELINELRSFRHRTLDELLDFAWGFANGLIGPWQVRSEIRALLELLAQRQPRAMLEIGTANGGSLFLFCRVLPPGARIISIDLPGGAFGGGYDESREPLYRAFALPGQELHLIRADSHQPATRRQAAALLQGKPLDFLFIDGDHTYSGVQADFEMYSPLVRREGLVAFHDIVVVPPHIAVGVDVHTYWQRIRSHYHFQEFIENPAQGWGGIGVLQRRPRGAPWGIELGLPPPPAPPPAPPTPPLPPPPTSRPRPTRRLLRRRRAPRTARMGPGRSRIRGTIRSGQGLRVTEGRRGGQAVGSTRAARRFRRR